MRRFTQQRFVIKILDVLEASKEVPDERRRQEPTTDELVCLKQAVDLLKVAEHLVQPENIERFPGAIASVRSARILVEEVMEALTAYFAAQGGAK
ncbi:hypothetical protein GCM10011487_28660 [Steroidobacter agaridevorans]|uniref:Uncharacterized protein n=1 Tax=Steroidobacter agaridevorans TaxID=2695856 RepID=A0A829YE18_9GAMM|nr:hypothetical protein [Steroidobacter agaridevorans]GFE80866.1 hypothetical protein GCM10011487_28660 [Steroidobacter agaridevorans]